jgi:hypothetical protein
MRLVCQCILVAYLLIAVLTSCNYFLLFLLIYWDETVTDQLPLWQLVSNTAALLCVQQETVCDWWHQKVKMFLQLTAVISYVSKMDKGNM